MLRVNVRPATYDPTQSILELSPDEKIELPADYIEQREREYDNMREADERIFDESIPLSQRLMIHFEKRMLFSEDLAPAFLASIGSYIADMHQAPPEENDMRGIPGGHGVPLVTNKGIPVPVSVPVTMVSPSGFSKSWIFGMFFDRDWGICDFPSAFKGKITEAAFSGSKEDDSKESVCEGNAYKYRDGFLIFNEISSLLMGSKAQHSQELMNQVMEALSERRISKDLKGLELAYDTRVILWGGIQPSRFNYSSGLARRMTFVTKAWSPEDVEKLRYEWLLEQLHRERGTLQNKDEINYLRKQFNELKKGICAEAYDWEEEMLRYVYSKTYTHLDVSELHRVLLGMAVIDQAFEKTIMIKRDRHMLKLADQIVEMMRIVAEGGDITLVLSVLGNKRMYTEELWEAFRGFSYQYQDMMKLLDTCVNQLGIVYTNTDTLTNRRYYEKATRSIYQPTAGKSASKDTELEVKKVA